MRSSLQTLRHQILLIAALAVLPFTAHAERISAVSIAEYVNLHRSDMLAPLPEPSLGLRADFGKEAASGEARHVADWVVDAADNQGKSFVIVDKVAAKVFVFDPAGRLVGAAPALLGIAQGDDSLPGIGTMELSAIRVQDRTTAAGRFVAQIGRNYSGHDVLWIDYDAALSMHRIINTNLKEKRPHRLATPTALDNRISFGCINVAVRFFEDIVMPAFADSNATKGSGIVYVLPETRSARQQFASYDVEEHSRSVIVQLQTLYRQH
jgi:hypothetical protein